jgi:hypothetical protein
MKRRETTEPCEWCNAIFAAKTDNGWVCTSCGNDGWGGNEPPDRWHKDPTPEQSKSKPGEWWVT